MVGTDGKLPVPAVDQHGQAHNAGPAKVNEGVQGGTDGAAGVQDVVNQDDNLVVDSGQRQLGAVRWPGGLVGEVVTEHGDVQLSDDGGGVHSGIRGGNFLREPDGQRIAAARNAEKHQVLGAFVGLEDLMGDTSECTVNIRMVENNPGRNRCLCDRSQRSSPLSPPHGTELKKEHLPSKITTLMVAESPGRGRRRSHPGLGPLATRTPQHRLMRMSMNPQQHGPGPSGNRPGDPQWQFHEQTNPTWMGHVRQQNYQPAPGHSGGSVAQVIPESASTVAARPSSGVLSLVMGGGVLAFVSLFLVVPFLLANTGVTGFTIGFVASLIPLGAVLLSVAHIDRWEPEPKRLLLFAFTWGAAVSIAVTLLIQPVFALAAPVSDEASYRDFMTTVQAPIVEEFAKSLGLLLLLLLARKHFDGPVDGVVFAFTIAGGFAFTENILYFGRAIAESATPGSDLAQIFFLRGVMSPFAHAIFTGTTGLIMGFAARRWHSGLSIAAFAVGLVPAMILHNRWNSMGQDFLAQYVLVQVPIFLLAVACIVVLRVAETRLTRQRLLEYSAAGWFTPAEVAMLATPGGRRQAVRWAGSYNRGPQMRAFVKAATRLAFTRQRILSGRDVQSHQQDELQQLRELVALRAAVGH